jgi:prefoldin subunit 5
MIKNEYQFGIPLAESISVQRSIENRINSLKGEQQPLTKTQENKIEELEQLWKDLDSHIAKLTKESFTGGS